MRGRMWARDEAEKFAIASAWYGEAFARTKRLPSLERLLSNPDEEEQTAEDIFEVLKALQECGAAMEIEEVERAPWDKP